MSSYSSTDEYRQLQHDRTALLHSCGNLRRSDDPEIALIDQKLTDGRWHHDHPGLAGSWRIAIPNLTGGLSPVACPSVPRFETEAAALAHIATLGEIERRYAKPLYRPSRQTLEAMTAKYGEAA